jgi:hypothetical protein
MPTDAEDFHATGAGAVIRERHILDNVEMPTDATDYHGTAGAIVIRERHIEQPPIPGNVTVTDNAPTGIYQFIKEVYTE